MSPVAMVPVTDEVVHDARQLALRLVDTLEQSGMDEARCGMAIATVLGSMAGCMPADKREMFFQAVSSTVNGIVAEMQKTGTEH